MSNDEAWGQMRDRIANMAEVLRYEVEDACPGPHACQQHRDSQMPWCAACGRTADGRLVQQRPRRERGRAWGA